MKPVLLIDGDKSRADAIARLLAECNLTLAPTAVAGLRELQAGRFDLAIINTTVQKPADGVKLAVLLVEKQVKRPPMVMLTRDPDVQHVKICGQAGVEDFVVEPKDLSELATRLMAVLERTHALHVRLTQAVAAYVGPAAPIFLQKGLDVMADGVRLESVTPEHLPKLMEWIRAQAPALIRHKTAEMMKRLESEFAGVR